VAASGESPHYYSDSDVERLARLMGASVTPRRTAKKRAPDYPMSLDEIASEMNCSRQTVQLVLASALRKLRRWAYSMGLRPEDLR
jgi:DNA-directed RNA polymerase specialized sigma24 family protein